MIKIAHEAPKAIFNRVQSLTDYDYALVHLFEEDEEYYQLFVSALQNNREVILDNSIFELGTAFDTSRYVYWINKLRPTYYIIPDALEDKAATIANFNQWDFSVPGIPIAVAQGATLNEFIECYLTLASKVDHIAISFDYSFFHELVPEKLPTKYHVWSRGRQRLLRMLVDNDIIDATKSHHLLGCGLANEFKHYQQYSFITSLDTSNPVVAGLKEMRYRCSDGWGLEDKPSEKLFTLINYVPSDMQIDDIVFNIRKFRENIYG